MRDRETHRSTRIGETVFRRFSAFARRRGRVCRYVCEHMCDHRPPQLRSNNEKYYIKLHPLRSRCAAAPRRGDKVPPRTLDIIQYNML